MIKDKILDNTAKHLIDRIEKLFSDYDSVENLTLDDNLAFIEEMSILLNECKSLLEKYLINR